MNLFGIALANVGTLAQALEDLLASLSADEAIRLSKFAERIQRDGRISIVELLQLATPVPRLATRTGRPYLGPLVVHGAPIIAAPRG